MKKFLALMLVLVMVLSLVACGTPEPTDPTDTTPTTPSTPAPSNPDPSTPAPSNPDPSEDTTPTEPEFALTDDGYDYTYRSYTTALGSNWNPHTWETNADSGVMSYIESPLATMSILDSENGVYQWVFVAATDITDVTADHQDDLTKYDVTLPEGQAVEETTHGYVFEIKLRPEMKWQDGTPINADTYIYSMKALLDPTMLNYRANLYYSGESAVAGGSKYYYSTTEGYYVPYTSVYASLADAAAAGDVYIDCWTFWGAAGYIDANGNECPQYVSITDETAYSADGAGSDEFSGAALYAGYAPYLEVGGGYEAYAAVYQVNEDMGATYDVVGCYKVDDYTIRYVTQAQIDFNYFLTSCTSNWLVYESLYEAGKDTTGELVTTNYGTSVDTTMSYGPYVLESFQAEKQMTFVQNPNYYLYTTDENGKLTAQTEYLVDGEHVTAYQTQRVVIDVMSDATAKQAFLKGALTEWAPPADELVNYTASSQLYQVDETYTMSFFFNTDVDALKAMDESKGNTNSVVLSNINFRKAFSLAIDRADWVTATAGYKPAYSLMNNLYFYDVYNDPTSMYRSTDEAMQAICDLYGVQYGEGTPYATLKDAYASINGYNLTEAKNLMATACQELVNAGLYTAGDPIHIRIGYKKGALDSADQNQMAKMNAYINAAAEGSGFGAITLEAIDNIADRYGDVAKGEFAVGYGAWGGAAFYPFRNMQVYCDPGQYDINEAACWDPTTETLTININGEDVTMTWQAWSNALVGTGVYANADFDVKLAVTAEMEEQYLAKYYRIPLAGSCVASLLSYQVEYYTDEYNIMYGFGGLELMTYTMTNAEWIDYIAGNGGTLSYE